MVCGNWNNLKSGWLNVRTSDAEPWERVVEITWSSHQRRGISSAVVDDAHRVPWKEKCTATLRWGTNTNAPLGLSKVKMFSGGGDFARFLYKFTKFGGELFQRGSKLQVGIFHKVTTNLQTWYLEETDKLPIIQFPAVLHRSGSLFQTNDAVANMETYPRSDLRRHCMTPPSTRLECSVPHQRCTGPRCSPGCRR